MWSAQLPENMRIHLPMASSRLFASMSAQARVRRLLASVCMVLLMPAALAQVVADAASSTVAHRYPAGSIQSVNDADKALAAIENERGVIESRYVTEEQACHPKFFATSCIEQARERRRKATMELRAVEIEANVFKRRARVEARDEALKERAVKDEADRLERARLQLEADNAKIAREPQVRPEAETERKAPGSIFPARQQRHDARMARMRAEEATKAKERAENVAEYEKKVEAAKARQLEITKRKAEKEQKRRLNQESVSEMK